MNCVLQSCFLTSVAKYESMLLCSFGLYRIKRGTVKVSIVVLTCFTWSTFAALKWLWKIKKKHVRYSTAVRNCKVNIVYLSNVYKCIVRRGCFDAEVDKILFLKRSLKAECGTCVSTCVRCQPFHRYLERSWCQCDDVHAAFLSFLDLWGVSGECGRQHDGRSFVSSRSWMASIVSVKTEKRPAADSQDADSNAKKPR